MGVKWADMSPRQRDALVAEKVMGLVVHPHGGVWDGKNPATYRTNFHPSTDIGAAWEVVEKLAEQNSGDLSVSIYQRKTFQPLWRCTITDSTFKQHVVYEHLSAPEAICKAALKAVGVDVE
jgi:hypothetical protein